MLGSCQWLWPTRWSHDESQALLSRHFKIRQLIRSLNMIEAWSLTMSKRSLSPAILPPSKRIHTNRITKTPPLQPLRFDNCLYDELILYIFSYLSWVDLCVSQPTNRNWARLTADNELWRTLYLRTYGRTRLRGSKGFITRADGREVKQLPGRAKSDQLKDWKWMFRISSNWRKGKFLGIRFFLVASSLH